MAYTTKYTSSFNTRFGNIYRLEILEDGYVGDPIPITLISANLRYPDGDREKYVPIRSSSLVLNVLCNKELPASSFLTDNVYHYKVILYLNETAVWYGWLDTKDLKMPLRDPNHAVELVARDGLNILAASDLMKLDNDPFTGVHSVLKYITGALKPTNLDLNIAAYCDFVPVGESNSINESTFYYANVHYSTFATTGSKYTNCYETLEKIMHSFKCTLFQADGRWNIVNWEQMYDRDGGVEGTLYDYEGVQIFGVAKDLIDIQVGLNAPHKFLNNDALITWTEAVDKITTNFRFDPPVSPIFNSTWEYVTFISPGNYYRPDGWQNILGSDPEIGYLYDGDTLVRKSLNIPQNSAVRSPEFLVNEGDLFKISFEVGNRLIISVILENGTNTAYLRGDGKWQTPPVTCADVTMDTFSIETFDKVPFSGRVHLDLVWGTRIVSFAATVSNLNVEITPVLNNEYTSNGYYLTRRKPSKQPVEITDEIYISSSPNHAVKGALLKHNTTGSNDYYETQNLWYRNGVDESVAFHDMMNRANFKMYFRSFLRIEAELLRVVADGSLLSPFSLFVHDHYTTKIFSLGSIDINLAKESAQITAVELKDSEIAFEDVDKLQGMINKQDVEIETPVEMKKPLSWRWGPTGVIIQLITKKRWGKLT